MKKLFLLAGLAVLAGANESQAGCGLLRSLFGGRCRPVVATRPPGGCQAPVILPSAPPATVRTEYRSAGDVPAATRMPATACPNGQCPNLPRIPAVRFDR